MVIHPQYEDDLIGALRHLREAKSLVDMINRGVKDHDDGGQRERLIQETLTSMAKRISSTRRELERLIPRRADWTLRDDPFRPKLGRGRVDEEPPIPPEPPED